MKKLQESGDTHIDASCTSDPTQKSQRIGPGEISLLLSKKKKKQET